MNAVDIEGVPTEITDPINAQILAVSEDRIDGFVIEPFAELARLAGISECVVIERLRAMLAAGAIRRISQTLMSTNLVPGALVAWQAPTDGLEYAFTYMSKDDPFSSDVVIRATDTDTPGSAYRLWTTLNVPQGYSMKKHCEFLKEQVGAISYTILPAKRLFALDAGPPRWMAVEPGSPSEKPGNEIGVDIVEMGELDWRVLTALKREFTVEEIQPEPWRSRARDAGESLDDFVRCANSLAARGVIGPFLTFLENVKTPSVDAAVTSYDALFHWRVLEGMEIAAGKEVGRHRFITQACWREAGAEFGNVNIMAVASGTSKKLVHEHKLLIDEHLREAGIDILYTNLFWAGRRETKPSEISPIEYAAWCRRIGCNPRDMRADTSETFGARG